MINPKTFLEYLRTVLITMFFVLLLATAFVALAGDYMIERTPVSPKQKELVQDYMINILIEKNKYLDSKFPNNYIYNLKLAYLYNLKKDYTKAEIELEKSVKKTPFGQYKPIFRQACFYAEQGEYKKAQKIMNSMGELPNKKLIEYKSDFYKLLADKLMQNSYVAQSVIKYERALFYQTKIPVPKEKLNNTKTSLINAYIVLADNYVKVGEISTAIEILNKAYKLIPSNLVKYKLALLYMDSEPKKSAVYFNDVLEEDPLLIDFKLYYDLLLKISQTEMKEGRETYSKLYKAKALNLEKYAIRNIIYPTDLAIQNISLDFSQDKKHKKNDMLLKLKLKNTSSFSILNLTLTVVFKDGDTIIDTFSNQIFTKANIFPSHETTPLLTINTSQQFKDENKLSDTITVEIYAFKNVKFKHLIGTYSVKKPQEFTQVRHKSVLQLYFETLPFVQYFSKFRHLHS